MRGSTYTRRRYPGPALALAALLGGCGAPPMTQTGVQHGTPDAAPRRASTTTQAARPDTDAAPEERTTTPVAALQSYLDGFHFYNGRMDTQVEQHRWCTRLDADFAQCAIFDGPGRDARLVGIEYVVSERLYTQLPPEEKRLWHSHAYEVRSGALAAPGLSPVAEYELMERLVRTYGKTWTTWQADAGHRLPTGTPQLMMSFTADGQIDPRLAAVRDQRLGVSMAANARNRAEIEAPPIDSEADAWQREREQRLALEPDVPAQAPPDAGPILETGKARHVDRAVTGDLARRPVQAGTPALRTAEAPSPR
jgi:hypothetical protein